MYKEKISISSNDVDSSLTLRVSSLFKLIQDVIMHHTEELGVGVKETIDKGILWVISRAYVEFYRLPHYQEEVTCYTYPGDPKLGLIYPRYFYMVDKNNEVLLRFSSIWALIDKNTRRPVSSKIIEERSKGEKYSDELPLPKKIEDIPSSLVMEKVIKYSDVDLNGHLNNTKYIELFQDLHSSMFYKEKKMATLLLNYNKEVKEGQKVSIYTSEGDEEFIKVTANGETSFFAIITYNSR